MGNSSAHICPIIAIDQSAPCQCTGRFMTDTAPQFCAEISDRGSKFRRRATLLPKCVYPASPFCKRIPSFSQKATSRAVWVPAHLSPVRSLNSSAPLSPIQGGLPRCHRGHATCRDAHRSIHPSIEPDLRVDGEPSGFISQPSIIFLSRCGRS